MRVLKGETVTRHDNRNLQGRKASAPSRIPAARLDALIAEAIVDAYTEAEQAVGFHATIEHTSRFRSRPSCWELQSP